MLNITKMKRSYVINHVMPSDLDKNDIKHGLKLKEEMLLGLTDEYVKQTIPNWKELERQYRKNGLVPYLEKLEADEITLDDIPKPNPIQCDVWFRYKDFRKNSFDPVTKTYDFDKEDGYSPWIKEDNTHTMTIIDKKDVMIQMQIVMDGENCGRYYPYQSHKCSSGLTFADSNILIYDPAVWDRNEDGTLAIDVDNTDEFCKIFFRNKKGYSRYDWYYEDVEWNKANYPDRDVVTITCDPFRAKYIGVRKLPDNIPEEEKEIIRAEFPGYYPDAALSGKQWVKCSYISEMINLVPYVIKFTFKDLP